MTGYFLFDSGYKILKLIPLASRVGAGGDSGFPLIYLPHQETFLIRKGGGGMKRILILSAGLVLTAGWISNAWAHGPYGSNSGTRSYGPSQSGFYQRSFNHRGAGFQQRHYRSFKHPRYGNRPHYNAHQFGPSRHFAPGFTRFPSARPDLIRKQPSLIKTRKMIRPLTQRHRKDFGSHKSLHRKNLKRRLLQTHPHPSPDPWFLYGKGDVLRQMGYLPQVMQPYRRAR